MTVRAALLLSLVLAAAPAFGQGTVAGIITGPGGVAPGAVLPGALVELSAAGNPQETVRTAVSRADGRYQLSGVPEGAYILTVQLPGFATVTRNNVVVADGATVTADVILLPQVGERFRFQPPRPPGGLLPPFESPQEQFRPCLHEGRETPAERARREDAVGTMNLIARALRMFQGDPPTWEALASSAAVAALRQQGDPLASRIQWGSSEPLPGWGIAWVTVDGEARYALVDMRDPCGFSISSESLAGRPGPNGGFRVVPLS
jgi:hypothetical protein